MDYALERVEDRASRELVSSRVRERLVTYASVMFVVIKQGCDRVHPSRLSILVPDHSAALTDGPRQGTSRTARADSAIRGHSMKP